MHYNRRTFINKSAMTLGALSIAGLSSAFTQKQKNFFKYALCNESLKEFSWPEQCEIIGKAGFDGVEIASFTLVKEGVYEITKSARKQMVRDMKNAGIVCAGLHWLFTPPPYGLHFTTPDNNVRQKSIKYLNDLIDFCGDMGGHVMVFGSPPQRSTTGGLSVEEATNNFADGLANVADHAKERDIKILIEPLGPDATDVINTLEQAVEVIRKVNHPAISSMFDFHNSVAETEPWPVLIKKYYKYIDHVHVQNMDGTYISSDAIPEDYMEVFRLLKDKDYKKWVSVEVFDFSPGGKFIADESMKTFLEIERNL